MRPTEKEIENVIKLDAYARYQYLIKKVADSGILFSLKNDENDWALAEVDNNKLFSIWSSKEFAAINAIGAWSSYNPFQISLEVFKEEIEPLIKENGYLLNIFSSLNKTGFIVMLEEFLRDLGEELEKYE
jgi:hypothetical protein